MSLTSVTMSEEVWLTCMTHALSTETEEIMGLLLGDIEHSNDGKITAKIWGALPQPRSDRQKDRVETNPEQLTAASILAEKMTVATGTTTRVIGWYHSHPHITVLPSHVDVRTQAMYQLMDSGFIGLIFSCFSEDAQKVGRIQVLAFQSLDGKHSHTRPLSLSLTPSRKNPAIDFESSLSSSDNAGALVVYSGGENMEQDTGDVHENAIASKVRVKSPRLGGFFAGADAKSGNSSQFNSLQNAISDVDPMDMSEGMQEAMHLSSLETSGAEFVRKEVPLYVVTASSLLCLESPLFSFTNLQRMLFEEEKKAYDEAIIQNTRNSKIHPLSFIHHTSTYRASICKIIEYCLSPAMTVLQDRLRENEIKLKLLEEEANILKSEISKGTSSNSSPNVLESKSSKGSSSNSSPLSPYQWRHRSVISSEHGDLYPVDSMSSPKK